MNEEVCVINPNNFPCEYETKHVLSKDFIFGFFQCKCNFILNKKNNSYEFKIQINMKKTKNNLLFLKDLKENYLNDIGRISIKKSIHYDIRKHNNIKYFIEKYLLNDNPFFGDEKIYYKIWVQAFKFYVRYSFRGNKPKLTTDFTTKKMKEYHNEFDKFKNHRIKKTICRSIEMYKENKEEVK